MRNNDNKKRHEISNLLISYLLKKKIKSCFILYLCIGKLFRLGKDSTKKENKVVYLFGSTFHIYSIEW